MQDYVGVRCYCGDESKAVTSYFDDRLLEADCVWISAAARLDIRRLYPVVDDQSGTVRF